MQIILAGTAKVDEMAVYFGLHNYWLAAAKNRNGANGGACRPLRDLVTLAITEKVRIMQSKKRPGDAQYI